MDTGAAEAVAVVVVVVVVVRIQAIIHQEALLWYVAASSIHVRLKREREMKGEKTQWKIFNVSLYYVYTLKTTMH